MTALCSLASPTPTLMNIQKLENEIKELLQDPKASLKTIKQLINIKNTLNQKYKENKALLEMLRR